jgi:hypothetical protein
MDDVVENKVFRDYRDNIIIDKNNLILAFKANRDRYTAKNQEKYAGLAQIGSIYSEDALTWNVFRTLEKTKSFLILEPLIGILKDPKILVWTLAFADDAFKLQAEVGNLIRNTDGRHYGQITEPDVIIETKDRLIVIECKLGHAHEYPSHLWEAIREDGPKRRFNDYFVNDHPFIDAIKTSLYQGEGYQLYRMAFYAFRLGMKLHKQPEFLSITNSTWWDVASSSKGSACNIWENFKQDINPNKLQIHNIFWQDIRECIDNHNNELQQLKQYLNQHICLR